ncbi:MAG: DUF3467 domain-containing protein [Acidobacteria bacterium]|nr:DUF3467 domain-containing protein [Acidobacteriota bacterium]
MTENPKKGPSVTLKISEEIQRGAYANKVIVAHSRDEFVFDFVADFPPGPQIVARVITAPAHAAALLEALGENLARYERQHGPIHRPHPDRGQPADA